MNPDEIKYDPATGVLTVTGDTLDRACLLAEYLEVPLDTLIERAHRLGLEEIKRSPQRLTEGEQ